MPDLNDMIRQLTGQNGSAQTIDQLRQMMNTPDARRAAQAISNQNADLLERAAQAAQRGDMATTAQIASQLMQTGEGARLADQLRGLFSSK